ncbi:MAG: hypothetical protein ACI9TH_003660, partial [Kiritimatiellia bacterium]
MTLRPRFFRIALLSSLASLGQVFAGDDHEPPHTPQCWEQIGQAIKGEGSNNKSGWSVSMSADGQRLAVGEPLNNNNSGPDAGRVRVYELVEGVWTQLGQKIKGEDAYDQSGYSVSLSADGQRVAIGANLNDGSGEDAGHVRVYKLVQNVWVQIGSDIDAEAAGDCGGYSVALSANGTRVAIGAILNDGNGTNAGQVRVYRQDGNAWIQMGADLDGEAHRDWAGTSVAISANGNRVAYGAMLNDGAGSQSGHARVFAWDNGTWNQVGADIDGASAYDHFGVSVSLSSDGDRLAIGGNQNDDHDNDGGHEDDTDDDDDDSGVARVYHLINGVWTQMGDDILGGDDDDQSGFAVALS